MTKTDNYRGRTTLIDGYDEYATAQEQGKRATSNKTTANAMAQRYGTSKIPAHNAYELDAMASDWWNCYLLNDKEIIAYTSRICGTKARTYGRDVDAQELITDALIWLTDNVKQSPTVKRIKQAISKQADIVAPNRPASAPWFMVFELQDDDGITLLSDDRQGEFETVETACDTVATLSNIADYKAHGATRIERKIINVLTGNHGITRRELCKRVGMTQEAVQDTLDGLADLIAYL